MSRMRRSTRTVFVLLLVAATAAPALADGWRSQARRNLDRDHDRQIADDDCQRDQIDQVDRHESFDHRVVQHPSGGATRPYWGTTRPYWGPNEPPGVIHRRLRTPDLKVR